MLENGTGTSEMLGIAGNILNKVHERADFLLKERSLTDTEREKTNNFLTSVFPLHARLNLLLAEH